MIKKVLPVLTLLLALNISLSAQLVSDSVSMANGYANDVFYSFQNGEVLNSDRAVWDIAFTTNAMSAAILVNVAAGIEAYEYTNGDTTDWATFDTTGFNTWPRLFNSDTTWEEGAFNQNAAGHPDYGWCMYNSVTHNLHGYKMYLVKWANGDMKKFWIKKKYSLAKTFVFTYSDLDNSNEQEITLDCAPYSTKNFVYYSMMNNQVLDYEPASDDWDIVFTRYQDLDTNYFVTGVLINYNTMGALVNSTDHTITDTTNVGFTEKISIIGSNWKAFNMGTFSWEIPDNMVFFVETQNGDVYRLVFTGFAGMGTGYIYFDKELLYTTSIFEAEALHFDMKIYPNPASDQINIIYSLPELKAEAEIRIYDLAGRLAYSNSFANQGRMLSISNLDLSQGTYILEMSSGNSSARQKLVIE
ncbi:MAG: T9SS type A sorting domain-containing protein [Bacteroidales bacterium]|nr:T9SS type A sorting domain-containing protein [Bacteroidales bacterium]MCF8455545.1 T9SS type A sorting domain-containing protein [Bacteroidales bacterium]